ncbi:MAG: YbjQ family protein [Hyphomicrobiaceae bacterium]
MILITTDVVPGRPVRLGRIVTACAISGANVLRDMREVITNTLGGKMLRYEGVLDETIERALEKLAEKAAVDGYDGVLGIKISHPSITDGAIEVVVIGTGFYVEHDPR